MVRPDSARIDARGSRVTPTYIYAARCHRVIDADTLELEIDLGFRTQCRQHIRVIGVDAPERYTLEGIAARQAVIELMAANPPIVVRTVKGQSFARWLGDVFVSGMLLSEWLLARGHVKSSGD